MRTNRDSQRNRLRKLSNLAWVVLAALLTGHAAATTSSLEFNVSEVPFSYPESSMSVCLNRRSKCLALTDLRFALFGRDNEIIRFLYQEGSDPIPLRALATPGQLSFSTGKEEAFARGCFESGRSFRLQGGEVPMVLQVDERLIQEGRLRVVAKDRKTFHIENTNKFGTSRHILSCLEGELKYDEEERQFRLLPSADHRYAIRVEESGPAWKATGARRGLEESADAAQREFDGFLSKMPSMPARYGKSRELASYIMWSCIVGKGGHHKRPGILMSKNWMHYIWSWDHCFNALACTYQLPEMAWDNYMTVLDLQKPGGRLPDLLGYARLDWACLKSPIHGWTLNRMQKEMELTDAQRQEAYETLERWTNYWLIERDSNKNGVPEYIQSNDCWDNGSEFIINGDPNFIANRESANLAAWIVLQMDQLHDLAAALGKQDEAGQWKEKSDTLLKKMLETLWDGERFLTINVDDGGSINEDSRSLMRFLPFVLGEKLPAEYRRKMVKDLKEGGYLTEWGLATESIHSKYYKENGYWQGPIWAPTTLIIVDGLHRAGEEDLAREIARRFCDMCVQSGFAENFDPKTGKGLRDLAYTWTASVFLVLGHEYLNGTPEPATRKTGAADAAPGTDASSGFTRTSEIADAGESAVQPNIIFIFSDDLSYRDLSCYGQESFSTPNLDRLANNGLRFSEAYSGSSACAPSRASLMTGMHMGHCRIRANHSVRGQEFLRAEDVTVAEILKQGGYRTGFIGKWGIGLPGTSGAPHKQGFDLAYGYYDQQRAHGFFPNYLMRNGKVEKHPENHGFNMRRVYQYNTRPVDKLEDVANRYDEDGRLIADGVPDPAAVSYSEDLFEREALKFIRGNQDQPFFLYYATQLPHGPCIIPDLGEFRDKPWDLKHKEWAAMMTRLDRSVGRIVGTLRELGIETNTVIFFAGDNGYSQWGYFGRPAWQDDPLFKNKGPWPQGKFSCTHEGGMRVPFFASWPGTIRAGETNHVCALYDFAATAAELAGVDAPPTDGISLVATLLGKTGRQPIHRYLYWQNESKSRHAQSTRFDSWWAFRPHPSQAVQLYDLANDRSCAKDLAGARPELVERALAIFAEAHSPSEWYLNPGEDDNQAEAKRQRGQASKGLTRSTGPNQRNEPR